jgi:hypothetical protein
VIRLAAGAASILLIGGIAATASACEASQASTSQPSALAQQWRVAATFSASGGATRIADIDAVSGSDAWAGGGTYFSAKKSTPLLAHWDGHSWRRVTLPAQTGKAWLADGISSVGASSATNVWAFGEFGRAGIRYAHLSGHRWIAGGIPGTAVSRSRLSLTALGPVSVISPTDVWVFGVRLSGQRVTPYAAQFTGHRWVTRTVPGTGAIVAATVISPHDIVALAGSAQFLGLGTSTPTVVRWNGRRWLPLPVRLHVPEPDNVSAMAVSDGHVWIGGDHPVGFSSEEYFAAELTGSTWKVTNLKGTAADGIAGTLISMVPDGEGGLWGLAASLTAGSAERLWHFTHGRWQAPVSPRFGGTSAALIQLAAIPGTRSVWAAGAVSRGGSAATYGLIAVAGPTPG